MIVPKIPADEDKRLNALLRQEILDTSDEAAFDLITDLAANLCHTKIALFSLIDQHRQWFKAKSGLEASETSREVSFCAHAINGDDIFEVPDTFEDERFKDNPLVTGYPNIRFYAGIPIHSKEGYRLGTLCIIDDHPRRLSREHREILATFGQMLEKLLALRLELLSNFRSLIDLLVFDAEMPAAEL